MNNSMPANPIKNEVSSRSRNAGRLALWGLSAVVLGLCLAQAGCVKSIYRRGDPRTQFDRYDASRNQFAPDYVEDEYGRLEPNLRGRLLVKD